MNLRRGGCTVGRDILISLPLKISWIEKDTTDEDTKREWQSKLIVAATCCTSDPQSGAE
jgi:hypothetical protein